MDGGFSSPTPSRKTDCFYFHLQSVFCLSFSIGTITCVFSFTRRRRVLTLFLQYIAQKLLEMNERGTYADPDSIPSSDPTRYTKLLAQEEELFQTARLINCAWFGSCIFSDYFSAILGLVRQGNSWSLNPFGVSDDRASPLLILRLMRIVYRKSERRTTLCLNADAVTFVVSSSTVFTDGMRPPLNVSLSVCLYKSASLILIALNVCR